MPLSLSFHSDDTHFSLVFANGYRLSVQWSEWHYCSPGTAEVAIIAPDSCFVPFPDGDDVMGHVNADIVSDIAHLVKHPDFNIEPGPEGPWPADFVTYINEFHNKGD